MEAAAVGGGQTCKLEELRTVISCCVQIGDRERFEVRTLDDELAQRPLLQDILVFEVHDRKFLEAFCFVDGAAKLVKHGVKYLRRSAFEVVVNTYVGGRLKVGLYDPVVDCVRGKILEALVYLHLVELDLALLNVLRTSMGDLGLER